MMLTPNPKSPTTVVEVDYDSENNARIINRETISFNRAPDVDFDFLEALRVRYLPGGDIVRQTLHEAFLNNPDFTNILRTDLKRVAFSAMANAQRTYTAFTSEMASNKPQEEYIRDAAIGVIPVYQSGAPRPQARQAFEGGTTIVNQQRSMIVPITGDMIRYDQIGKVKQTAQEMGLAAVLTDEQTAYDAITNTANYTRNSTTNDNDIGANQQTLTFNADSLRTAKSIIGTAKDRKSGAYLGFNADTIIAGTRLEIPVLQLLTSAQLERTHGATTVEAIGTGTSNPFQGQIRRVIFSPWFGASFQWALCDSTRMSFIRQNVLGWNIFQESMSETSDSYMKLDSINYMIQAIFGLGFVDDRAWVYSDSTTDATVS